jgi:hypothetical protein
MRKPFIDLDMRIMNSVPICKCPNLSSTKFRASAKLNLVQETKKGIDLTFQYHFVGEMWGETINTSVSIPDN